MHLGQPSISATIPPPHHPIQPTWFVNHPTGPHGPTFGPLLGLGRDLELEASGPGPPLVFLFLVFCFSPLPTGSDPLGRPLTERLKTLRPAELRERLADMRDGSAEADLRRTRLVGA